MAHVLNIKYGVCWSCTSTVDINSFFCETCHIIQNPADITHFERFGLPAIFELDLNDLYKRYLDLQRQVHPDRFVQKSSQEKLFSERHTALLNEGYEILKSPVKRAFYLLKLFGFDTEEDSSAAHKDPTILLEIMELREAHAEITTATDQQNFRHQLHHEIVSAVEEINQAFQHDQPERAYHPSLRLRYLTRFEDELLANDDYTLRRVVN